MTTNPEPESVYSLAFETSSALGEVALGRGADVIAIRTMSGPRMHAREFVPAIASLCAEHDVRPEMIRFVFVSSGPGSFTGLRIGVTAARMLGLASNAALVAAPTLEVIAQNALDAPGVMNVDVPPQRVVVVLDAKRSRVYAAAFVLDGARYKPATDPVETEPGPFLAEQLNLDKSCAVLGEGVDYHRAAVEASAALILPAPLYQPRAVTVYRLGVKRVGEGYAPGWRDLLPTYIRPPEAEEKWAERQNRQKD